MDNQVLDCRLELHKKEYFERIPLLLSMILLYAIMVQVMKDENEKAAK